MGILLISVCKKKAGITSVWGFFKLVLHGRKAIIILPWSGGCVMPWHQARASPAKITWLGHQRQGPQHIVEQGPAQSRDDWVMRTLCLQTSWHDSWLPCHLCSCWFLLLCFPFGWVVVETEVDLARWSGDIISDQTQADWASLGAGELLGEVLSGSSGCFPWCICCKTALGSVVLGKALLPPELWVAEVAAQHRNCVTEVFMPYLIRSVGDSWLNHKPGEIKM